MQSLAELDVLIVDCQATGASPAFGSVLELGWGIATPGRAELEGLQAHWIALPEGHVVSRQVRRLTGFEDRFASSALPADEAWNRLRANTTNARPMPSVIHYARFELAFLREWAARFEPEAPFPFDTVCVHALAERLYPELPRRSIRALAGYLGFGLHLERRSLGHVEATAFIWRKLCLELAGRGVHTWGALREFLAESASRPPRSSKRRYPIEPARYRSLPDAPGVYRFVRSNGDVLYVGKAASVRKRVASHFTARTTREHSLEMLTQASDVWVTDAATALEAALLENETIKTLRPIYNVQLVDDDGPAWFASKTFALASERRDEAHSIGPLPSQYSLRPLAAQLELASAGVTRSRSLRAWAVAAAEFWAPDEAVFDEGYARFANENFTGSQVAAARDARQRILLAAKNLISAKASARTPDEPEDEVVSEDAPIWDPERVARHLERALARAYQLMRRARWLCLAHESTIVYREPASTLARVLIVRGGELVEARDGHPGDEVRAPDRGTPLHARPAAFDRVKYDRLRILTTELKRVLRDGGEVTVHFSRERRLTDAGLASALRWV